MPIVRIEHSVPNFDKWKEAFDRDPVDRKRSGVLRYSILRQRDDPHFVMIDLEFGSLEEAEAFLRAMERIWSGPSSAFMRNPRARIADVVEVEAL